MSRDYSYRVRLHTEVLCERAYELVIRRAVDRRRRNSNAQLAVLFTHDLCA